MKVGIPYDFVMKWGIAHGSVMGWFTRYDFVMEWGTLVEGGPPISRDSTFEPFGTSPFASIYAHQEFPASPRDDLISLAYTMIYLSVETEYPLYNFVGKWFTHYNFIVKWVHITNS